jgi:hypothetical protein
MMRVNAKAGEYLTSDSAKCREILLATIARGWHDSGQEARRTARGCSLEKRVKNLPCHARD